MIRVFTSPMQAVGEQGEDSAAQWLTRQGFAVVERNIANKFGEIDIVAKKGTIHYFFEVKTGRQGSWLNPAENLTKTKLRKFLISCEHYALVHQIADYRAQGVIVLISNNQPPKVEIIDIV